MPRKKKKRLEIGCACGCGELLVTPNKSGDARKYIDGHWQCSDENYLRLKSLNAQRLHEHSFRAGIEGKMCHACHHWYPLAEYYKNKTSFDGLTYRCKSCQKKKALGYYNKHRDRINAERRTPEYREKMRPYFQKWSKEKSQTDVHYRLKRRLRHSLWRAFKGHRREQHILELLGCGIEALKAYLESKFQDGMAWDNYGQPGWEIDHIIPISAFDLTDSKQLVECFHYTNLQPLWGPDNWAKSNKIL